MSEKLRIIVKVFTIATIILAIATAYVIGVMEGVQSQQMRIKELEEELYGFIDFVVPWRHPLLVPLLCIALIFGVCWIAIAVIASQEKRKEQT